MTDLGQQNIVNQLVVVAAKDALLKMPHRVGASQTHFAAVEIELATGGRVHVLAETPHAELLLDRIQGPPAFDQLELQLIEPGRIEIPMPRVRQFDRDTVIIDAAADWLIDMGVRELIDVSVAADLRRLRRVRAVLENSLTEVLPEQRKLKMDRHLVRVAVEHLDPCLGPVFPGQGPHEQIVDELPGAGLDAHRLANPHTGWTVMPACPGIIIAEPG